MKNVVIGFLGTKLDMGKMRKWKPTPSLFVHDDFPVERLELLYDNRYLRLAEKIQREISYTSPETEVILNEMNLADPWDFQEVYGAMFDFARNYGFDDEREQYHLHLTTGTHVAQICWFLLAESRHVPAKLVQTGPPRGEDRQPTLDIIDLDLSRYNALQQRFDLMSRENSDLLKGGIGTKNPAFNKMIDHVELVAGASDAPILLLGETGTGKTELAQRIYDLKLQRRRVKGRMVHVNCATLKGDHALAMLFGQRRSFTGAAGTERGGLLREADGGVLFLDELDQLGLDEQAAILHAIETGRYYPLGSDHEVSSRFQVIASSNRDLTGLVAEGRFRPDLLARINMWRFYLPALRDRPEDVEANLMHELTRTSRQLGAEYGFNADAAAGYMAFAKDPATPWPANFRDLGGSVQRLCTLAPRGRITLAMVGDEIATLRQNWRASEAEPDRTLIKSVMGGEAETLDPFDVVQLALVIRTCRHSSSLSAAGRTLFAQSRAKRASKNDSDRLRKYLGKFGLDWDQVQHVT